MNNNNNKRVVIFENGKIPLKRVNESLENTDKKEYIFEGICASFGNGEKVKNNNGRYYDRKEYLSHFDYLLPQIQQHSLAGSLDHPEEDEDEEKDIFTPKMKDLSHLIIDLWYKEESDEVWIKIKLIDTTWGRDAMACADAGMPIFISSRASGYVKDDGRVILDQIHTYDIVYRPGFGNARLNPVLESFECESFSTRIFECKSLNNKSKDNNMTEKYITEDQFNERMVKINEAFSKINKVRFAINESDLNGKAIMGGVVSASGIEFIWVLNGNGDKLDLMTKDANGQYVTVLSDAPQSVKVTASSFIANYKQPEIEGSLDLIAAIQNNFQGNPLFEGLEGKVPTSDELISFKGSKNDDNYMPMLMNYLMNSSDDTDTKLDIANTYVKEVWKEDMLEEDETGTSVYNDEDKKRILDAFIESNKQYYVVSEDRKRCVTECIKIARKDYKYIKESIVSKKINECDDAIEFVTDFIKCEGKPISQKIDLIETLNGNFDNCNYEICDDPEMTLVGYDEVNSYNPDCEIIERLSERCQKNFDCYNIMAKRINSVTDYLNYVADEINQTADSLGGRMTIMETTNARMIESMKIMEARVNHVVEYCEMISGGVNNLADYASLSSKRINTVADYAESIAESINENFDSQDKKIKTISESLKLNGKKTEKDYLNIDQKLESVIESVIKGKRSITSINENTNKKKVFENNGTLRIPSVYQKAWNGLSESKKNEISCLFEFRNPKSSEEVSAIWESLNLGSQRLITAGNKKPIQVTVANGLGYNDNDISNLLGV